MLTYLFNKQTNYLFIVYVPSLWRAGCLKAHCLLISLYPVFGGMSARRVYVYLVNKRLKKYMLNNISNKI